MGDNRDMTQPIEVPEVHTEPVSSVMRILQLQQTPEDPLEDNGDEDSFYGRSLPQTRRIYGGQVIAQGLLAAAATVEDKTRLPNSLHAYFLRGGKPEDTIRFDVNRLRDGRSFSSRQVTAWQDERELLTMTSSFHANEEGPESQYLMPQVPAPENLDSALELFRTMDHPVAKFLGKTAAFDVRHVQDSLYTEPAPELGTTQEIWMKPRAELPKDMSQAVQRALLAYVVDQVMLEPSLRSVGLTWSTPGMSLASLDHAMWFHRDVPINEWLLFAGRSNAVRGSRAKSEISIYRRSGDLIATAAQEGMVRVPEDSEHASSHWTF